jgi:ribosomal protein S18 acetylase RimI-like enzyme
MDAYRRHGLGRKLMEFLWQIGRQKRFDKIMLTVFKGMDTALLFGSIITVFASVNETAINFYETMGCSHEFSFLQT